MPDIRQVGESASRGCRLYLAPLETSSDWLSRLEGLAKPFVAFTAFDATQWSDAQLSDLARNLLDRGCVYSCSWGPDAGRVELAFDQVVVDAELAKQPYLDRDTVVTTSHENESLDDALWFAVFAAFPAYVEPAAVVAIAERKWAKDIETRFADSEEWSARVLEAEEDAGHEFGRGSEPPPPHDEFWR